jgi:hypothetical protein
MDYWHSIIELLTQKPHDAIYRLVFQFGSFIDQCTEELAALELAAELTEGLIQYLSDNSPMDSRFSTVDEWISYCDSNPPVFVPSKPIPDSFFCPPVKSPIFGHLVSRMSIDSDGVKETCIRLIHYRGESHVFVLLSARLYHFSLRESLFFGVIARMVHRHPACVAKSHFISFPSSYRIHPQIQAVDCRGFVTFREIVRPFKSLKLIATARSTGKGFVATNARRAALPGDLLLTWALRGADGNRNNFLFCRQSIATHLGAFACLQTILGKALPTVPSILLSVDRRSICFPGMLNWNVGIAVPPLTDQFKRYLPQAVMAGSFTTAWQVVANALAKNLGKVEVLFGAFLRDQRNEETTLKRIKVMAVTEEQDAGPVWAFDLLQHLIESANNNLSADPSMIAWI